MIHCLTQTYTSHTCTITVDIIVRQLNDLSPGDQVIHCLTQQSTYTSHTCTITVVLSKTNVSVILAAHYGAVPMGTSVQLGSVQ